MITKKIHYCWFGKNPKSKLIKKCIASWRKHLPEYEVIEWNEDNFDIKSNRYVKEAYEAKKWAFVSDYVRLWALKEFGGIYMDTDVEVFKKFDMFLHHGFFTGYERYGESISPITAVMGSKQNHPLVAKLFDEYKDIAFLMPDGSFNITTNTSRITSFLVNNYGVHATNDTYQVLADDIHIYPSTYFCMEHKDSYSIHHFDASWKPLKKRLKARIKHSKRIPKTLGKIICKFL